MSLLVTLLGQTGVGGEVTLTGDVTGSGIGTFATTISAGAVSLGKMSNLAANTIIGNNTGVPATPIALTIPQVQAMLGDNSSTLVVNQVGHGFFQNQIIQSSGANNIYQWAVADNTADSLSLGVVTNVANANTFTFQFGGLVTTLVGLTAGSLYYLDPATPGDFTTVAPTAGGQIVKPLFIAINATSAIWLNYNGIPALTNGQLIIGSTGATPVVSTITGSTSIAVTNGAGSITLSSTGAGLWIDQTATPVTMALNNKYVADNGATQTVFALPAVVPFGTTFQIVGMSAGGWTIQQGANQYIHYGNEITTVGAGGSLSSSNQYDSVQIVCLVANNGFSVFNSQGNLDYV